jgi:hypothetical protein|tara:strand:+ start:266 stop:898 length:633 start_codon:yes stop_codon:yes gene_type:complete
MKNVLKTIKVQGGKEYAEVHTRVNYFRSTEQFKGWGQDCEIIHQTDTSIIMKATIYYPDGRIASTGYAKEDIDGARINQRNHVEVCDTSAVGRALGFLGIGINQGSIASYEEVMNAKVNEKIDALKDKELNLGIPKKEVKKSAPKKNKETQVMSLAIGDDKWYDVLHKIVKYRDDGKDFKTIMTSLKKQYTYNIKTEKHIKEIYDGEKIK